MKILRVFVGFVLFVMLLATASWVIQAAVSSESWQALVAWVGNARLTLPFMLVGLICLAVIFALSGFSSNKREQFLSFDGENGTVSISTTAICDYIVKLSGEFPSIQKLTPTVIPRKNQIDIVANLRVKAGPNIHELCELLQQRIRETLTNGLGISQIRRIEVSVKDIVSEHKPS